MKYDLRTPEQVREHYEIEKELAARLRNASRQERRLLYSSLYDELFRRVPMHPQLTHKASPENTARAVAEKVKLLRRFVNSGSTLLEVGPGDCALSLQMSRHVKTVYAVDVSDEITKDLRAPGNFRLVLSDGCSIPVSEGSVDVAYSDQLMEHLHPDDAYEQLRNLCRALVPGGIYFCITPNRLGGPHDVSRGFDPVPTGFHLKEYTYAELQALFRRAGFTRVRAYVGAREVLVRWPLAPLIWLESMLDALPYTWKTPLARCLPVRVLLGIRLAGIK